ncbi:Mur ligase, partial [Amylostereum chailletii]
MSIDLSLDRVKILLAHLPTYDRPTIHIAGTNGKGSTSALVSSILHTGGLSVGRFNSPHLVSVRDSISLDGLPVDELDYASAREEVMRADAEHGTHVTNFELLTCTALYVFQRAQVDVAVLEVGLGGRLDATNAIPDECVLVSALTAVDLDHQAFLGDTVEKIAKEKAAIARKGRPFVLGPQKHGEVLSVVKDVLAQVGADLVQAKTPAHREWDQIIDGQYSRKQDQSFWELPPQSITLEMSCFAAPLQAQLPLPGEHQLDNLGTAIEIINTLLTHPSCVRFTRSDIITPEIVVSGVKSTRWRGRLSFHKVPLDKLHLDKGRDLPSDGTLTVLADGAHNPASA